jgi:hypothetical protein
MHCVRTPEEDHVGPSAIDLHLNGILPKVGQPHRAVANLEIPADAPPRRGPAIPATPSLAGYYRPS